VSATAFYFIRNKEFESERSFFFAHVWIVICFDQIFHNIIYLYFRKENACLCWQQPIVPSI
jgi:hypothetical protein